MIVDLIAPSGDARKQLLAIEGVAASIITDQAPRDAAMVVTCDGPRTRIYCIYDDNALDPENLNEAQLQHDATAGDWAVSLPCLADDLEWVRAALKRSTPRITARDASEKLSDGEGSAKAAVAGGFVVDLKGVFGS